MSSFYDNEVESPFKDKSTGEYVSPDKALSMLRNQDRGLAAAA